MQMSSVLNRPDWPPTLLLADGNDMEASGGRPSSTGNLGQPGNQVRKCTRLIEARLQI